MAAMVSFCNENMYKLKFAALSVKYKFMFYFM